MANPVFYNMDKWIQANSQYFTPPVCNKMMHSNQLQIFFVGGPNIRKDFHIEKGEEIFYMKKGDMLLRILQNGQFEDIPIKEGEIFLLPARIPHSPQRSTNTIGMVIERERKSTELDALRWYIEGTTDILYEEWFQLKSLGTQVAEAIKRFFASEEHRTGRPRKDVTRITPPYQLNDNIKITKPFSLKHWLNTHRKEIDENGCKSLFGDSYQTQLNVYGSKEIDSFNGLHDAFVWQLSGTRTFIINGKKYHIDAGDTLLIPPDVSYKSIDSSDSLTLLITMDPIRS